MRSKLAMLVGGLAAAMAPLGAGAAEITLKGVSSFAEGTSFSRPFERFIDKVNAEGKGLVQINYIGGPRAIPPFEVANAARTGVVDIANTTGAFYTNILPESDALKLSTLSAQELRKNGAWEYINKLWNERVNVYYLARTGDNIPFHLYLTKRIDKPDFTGLKIRVTPVYRDFFQALGATVVTTPPGEVYTALERGVVDGYGWPILGIFDLGWQDKTKFRVDPGFYNVEVSLLVNLDTWKKLDAQQQAFLGRQAIWLESLNPEAEALNAEEAKRQAAAGIQTISFAGEVGRQYLARATEVGWKSIIDKSPEHGPKLRVLLTTR
ncbi:MAG: TRAP transporter substrate-binding protein DctP [Pseudomonadota bacterium]